jgi:Uma2 family endonuclease
VKAVFVEVPQEILDHRRVTGLDRYDEMWEGVLHMAPAPKISHQAIVAGLIGALGHAVRGSDRMVVDGINVCDPADIHGNFRVPDVCVLDRAAPAVGDDFGRAEGVLLAVEVRSPRDETYDKFSFYAARSVQQLLIIDVHLSVVEVFSLTDGTYVRQPELDGWVVTDEGVRVQLDDEGQVIIRWIDGTIEVI